MRQARAYQLDPPILNDDMDTLVGESVRNIADAESNLLKYLRHIENNARPESEIATVAQVVKRLKDIERMSYYDALDDAYERWDERQNEEETG